MEWISSGTERYLWKYYFVASLLVHMKSFIRLFARINRKYGVLRKLKHIFPNTYQRIKSICSPAKGGTGCYRFNYQPGS